MRARPTLTKGAEDGDSGVGGANHPICSGQARGRLAFLKHRVASAPIVWEQSFFSRKGPQLCRECSLCALSVESDRARKNALPLLPATTQRARVGWTTASRGRERGADTTARQMASRSWQSACAFFLASAAQILHAGRCLSTGNVCRVARFKASTPRPTRCQSTTTLRVAEKRVSKRRARELRIAKIWVTCRPEFRRRK